MSLILDALKKSEAERMRGQLPTLLSPLPAVQSQTRAREKSRLPLLLLIAFLLIALILGYFYAKNQPVRSPGIVTEVANQTTEKTPAVIEPPVIALTPKPTTMQATVAATVIAPTPAPAAPVIPTSIALETSEATPVITEATPATSIASLAELPTEQRQQLPTLKLSMHVYSQEASKRFAIIDGQRVNEGSVLGTAVVVQIRQDGVVLSVQGQSYLLPRP
jgi:general secretion pathway protein B